MNLQEIRRMQFLAGIISEGELESVGKEVTVNDINTDVIENMPEVQMAADMIMSNPSALAQLEKFANMAGVDYGLNESLEGYDEVDDFEIQKMADLINDMMDSDNNISEEKEADSEDKEKEKPSLVLTAASIGGALPFIPGISGLITQAAEATGIPAMAFGAASVLAAAVVGGILNNIVKKKMEQKL